MQRLPDLQRLRRDLVNGNRLKFDIPLQLLILSQLERILDASVVWENHLISLSTQGTDMREVRDLAAGMKDAIASIRKTATDAKGSLAVEISRAQVNAAKVSSFADELKEANLEVEEFLGETGSNFPSSEASPTPASESKKSTGHEELKPRADLNGVTLNTEGTK